MPFHPRNKHQGFYDWNQLVEAVPSLKDYFITKKDGELSINFGHPQAVFLLNKALLAVHYQVKNWNIPEKSLCPPIPSRADYVHYLADLLGDGAELPPHGKKVKVLDIGVGANCIYPILGNKIYGWSFVGVDINLDSIKWAHNLLAEEPQWREQIHLRWQENSKFFFRDILKKGEQFDAVMCNPPFFKSAKQALAKQKRKWHNLNLDQPVPNFGGQAHELYCKGGELSFITRMISESTNFQQQVKWFTVLVSRESHLKPLYKELEKLPISKVETIPMQHGNKKSRILCWSF